MTPFNLGCSICAFSLPCLFFFCLGLPSVDLGPGAHPTCDSRWPTPPLDPAASGASAPEPQFGASDGVLQIKKWRAHWEAFYILLIVV